MGYGFFLFMCVLIGIFVEVNASGNGCFDELRAFNVGNEDLNGWWCIGLKGSLFLL